MKDELKAVGFEKGAHKGGHALLCRNGGPRGKMLDVRRLVWVLGLAGMKEEKMGMVAWGKQVGIKDEWWGK